MKKAVKIVITLCIIAFVADMTVAGLSYYLTKRIQTLYSQKEDALSLINGEPAKDKGNVWIQQSAKHHDLMLMGSSELSSPVRQNIKFNYPNTTYPHNISTMGHADVQNMLHAIDIGANEESYRKSDVVIVESIQWFFGDDISQDGFMSNFSELQFYEFLKNPHISYKNKDYLCKRFLEMDNRRAVVMTEDNIAKIEDSRLSGIAGKVAKHIHFKIPVSEYDYPQTHILAKMYISHNPMKKCVYMLLQPYYHFRYGLMKIKDQYAAYQYLKAVDGSYNKKIFETDWKSQMATAEIEGKTSCTNNDIYVYDDYYTTYLKDSWETQKDSNSGVSALNSKEWGDFQFLLSVCRELGIKPYIINVSCNGYYYDYTGLDPAMRQKYYARLDKTAAQYGVSAYSDLKNKEYEPYVFVDVMHLGWKGWIYVTKAITEHFK